MAFPVVRSSKLTQQTSNSTSWTLTFPFEAGDIKDGGSDYVVAGDLILVTVGQDGTGGSGSIPDFTQIYSQASAACRGVTLAKVATGSETNLTYSPGASEQGVARVVVIKNWYGTIGSGIEAGGTATGTDSSPDPGSFNPVTWDVEDTYWRACAAHDDGNDVINAFPSNFTDNPNADSSVGGNGAGLGSAGLASGIASVDPGTFTISAAEQWVAWVIAIRPAAPSKTYNQTHFRVRTDDSVGLNTDSGWAGSEDQGVTIGRGERFRIRMKMSETSDLGVPNQPLHAQYRLNSGTWTDFYELAVGTGMEQPPQSMPSVIFADSAATSTELLTNDGRTYRSGVGDTNNVFTTSIDNQETEIELCLQIQSTYDNGGTHNEIISGAFLNFRLVEGVLGASTPFTGSYTKIPTITVADNDYYIGGTYVESPNNIGPFKDANDNLYMLCEYAETFNDMTIRKSTNNGLTWRVIDGPNRPAENDLEGADVVQFGDELFMMIVTTTVTFHSFRTSDNASPDTWNIKDQVIDNTYTAHTSQNGALERRADGTFVAFYNDAAAPDRVRYRIRSTGGTWGGLNTVDTEASVNFTSVRTVKDSSDTIHIFYKDDTNGILYYRTLSSGDALSGRTSIATGLDTASASDNIPHIAPTYWNDGNERILLTYQKAQDAVLYSKLFTDGTPGSEIQATDFTCNTGFGASAMPAASLTLDSGTNDSYLLYSRISNGDIYLAKYTAGSGWGADSLLHNMDVRADWINANVYTRGADQILGYVYDDASDGGSGQIWYGEAVLSGAAATFTPLVNAFRFYDDGTESGSSPLGIQNANITRDVASGDRKVHLRYRIQESGGADGATTDDYGLEYRKNGGSWTAVTASSSNVKSDTASGLTDGAATTNRGTNGISDGTGSFVAGEQEEGNGVIEDLQLTTDNFTEVVWALSVIQADVAETNTLEFRVTLNGGSPGITNSVTPQITITKEEIVFGASGNIAAGGENTTARLTAPAGKTSGSDFVAGRIQDDENPADVVDITTDDYSEFEWSLLAVNGVPVSTVFEFRLTASGTPLTTYTVTPQWTIGLGSGQSYSFSGTIASTSSVYSTNGTIKRDRPVESTVTATGNVNTVSRALEVARPLAGSIAGTSTLTAQIDRNRGLTGTVSGISTATASLVVAHSLEGTTQALAILSAQLAVSHSLQSSIVGTSTGSASLSVAHTLQGTIPCTSTVTGDTTNSVSCDSAIAGTSTLSGSLSVTKPLQGICVGTSSVSDADLTVAHSLEGSIVGSSTLSATLTVVGAQINLEGTIAATSTVTGSLTVAHSLEGSIVGTSTVSDASLAVTKPLTGSIVGTSSISTARLNLAWGLYGSISGASTVSGRLSVAHSLQGAIVGTSTVSGNTTIQYIFIGSIAGTSELTGVLVVAHTLQGSIAGSSTVAGNLVVAHSLQGTIVGTSTLSGSIDVGGSFALEGTIAGTGALTGRLSVTRPLTGNIVGTSSTSGSLTITHSLQGSIIGTSTLENAPINIVKVFFGSIAGTSTLSGRLTVAHSLQGNIVAVSTLTGQIRIQLVLFGTIAATSTVDDTDYLQVAHSLQGAVVGTCSVSQATVDRDRGLLCAFAGTSTLTGTLTVEGPPAPQSRPYYYYNLVRPYGVF